MTVFSIVSFGSNYARTRGSFAFVQHITFILQLHVSASRCTGLFLFPVLFVLDMPYFLMSGLIHQCYFILHVEIFRHVVVC